MRKLFRWHMKLSGAAAENAFNPLGGLMATQSIPTGLQTIPLASIIPNVNNPRKHFDPAALKELAKSIESHGVRQPILVRPDPFESKNYELIVGERRWRASKLAGKKDIPAIVDVLSDREALEVMVIENQQRQDVSPLEEARGYQALMNLGADNGTAAHTVESIAAKVGKSVGYVYARLKLIALIPAASELLEGGDITPGHAILIARLQPIDQFKALAACFKTYMTKDEDAEIKKLDPNTDKWEALADVLGLSVDNPELGITSDLRLASEKSLREWIQDNVNLRLKDAPWDLSHEFLIPDAGSCAKCPKRSGSNPALFAELTVKGEDTCFDPACFRQKREAFVQLQIDADRRKAKEAAKGGTIENPDPKHEPLRQISEQSGYTKPKPDQRVLKAGQWLPAKKGECDSVEQGLIVRGEHAGEKKLVCCNGACKVHKHHLQAEPAGRSEPKTAFDREALEREREIELALDEHVKKLLLTKVDGADRPLLLLIATHFLWGSGVKPSALAKLPLHKAWSVLAQDVLKQVFMDDGFDSLGLQDFAKAHKLDLAKIEKDFRAKLAKPVEPAKSQTSAKPKKRK
jgi:ParB family transcriptional regulator, chromosome partitioning protein